MGFLTLDVLRAFAEGTEEEWSRPEAKGYNSCTVEFAGP